MQDIENAPDNMTCFESSDTFLFYPSGHRMTYVVYIIHAPHSPFDVECLLCYVKGRLDLSECLSDIL